MPNLLLSPNAYLISGFFLFSIFRYSTIFFFVILFFKCVNERVRVFTTRSVHLFPSCNTSCNTRQSVDITDCQSLSLPYLTRENAYWLIHVCNEEQNNTQSSNSKKQTKKKNIKTKQELQNKKRINKKKMKQKKCLCRR